MLFVIRERELVHEIRRKRYEIPQNHSQSLEYFAFPRTDFAFRDKKRELVHEICRNVTKYPKSLSK